MATEARGPDRHLGAGKRLVELQLDQRGLHRLAPVGQALVQAMQAPDVARVLAGAGERRVSMNCLCIILQIEASLRERWWTGQISAR